MRGRAIVMNLRVIMVTVERAMTTVEMAMMKVEMTVEMTMMTVEMAAVLTRKQMKVLLLWLLNNSLSGWFGSFSNIRYQISNLLPKIPTLAISLLAVEVKSGSGEM